MWYMNGSTFQIFLKLELKLAQIYENLKKEKMGNFGQNLAQNQADWYMNGSHFLGKLVYVRVQFQIPSSTSLLKTKLKLPTPLELYIYPTQHELEVRTSLQNFQGIFSNLIYMY